MVVFFTYLCPLDDCVVQLLAVKCNVGAWGCTSFFLVYQATK